MAGVADDGRRGRCLRGSLLRRARTQPGLIQVQFPGEALARLGAALFRARTTDDAIEKA